MAYRTSSARASALSTGDQSRTDALALLGRCHVEFLCRGHHPNGPGLRDAADVALRGVQADLLRLSSPVEFQTARRLMRERLWALAWWIDHLGHRGAKARLLELTDGGPLTICMGDMHRPDNLRPGLGRFKKKTISVYGIGDVGITVRGCRAVMSESTTLHASSRMWRRFCDDCSNDSKRPHRAEARSVRRRLDAVRRGDTATVYTYLGPAEEASTDGPRGLAAPRRQATAPAPEPNSPSRHAAPGAGRDMPCGGSGRDVA